MNIADYSNLLTFLAIAVMGVLFIIFMIAVAEESESFEENLRIISEAPKE